MTLSWFFNLSFQLTFLHWLLDSLIQIIFPSSLTSFHSSTYTLYSILSFPLSLPPSSLPPWFYALCPVIISIVVVGVIATLDGRKHIIECSNSEALYGFEASGGHYFVGFPLRCPDGEYRWLGVWRCYSKKVQNSLFSVVSSICYLFTFYIHILHMFYIHVVHNT